CCSRRGSSAGESGTKTVVPGTSSETSASTILPAEAGRARPRVHPKLNATEAFVRERKQIQQFHQEYYRNVFAVSLKTFRGCTVNYFEQLIAVLDALLVKLKAHPWDPQQEPITFLLPSTPYGWGGAILASPSRVRFQTSTALPLCLDAAVPGGYETLAHQEEHSDRDKEFQLHPGGAGPAAGQFSQHGLVQDTRAPTASRSFRSFVPASQVSAALETSRGRPRKITGSAFGPRDSDELWKKVKVEVVVDDKLEEQKLEQDNGLNNNRVIEQRQRTTHQLQGLMSTSSSSGSAGAAPRKIL
ncbi:unnamed protein product, partial [Amoebophrya sp. A120]